MTKLAQNLPLLVPEQQCLRPPQLHTTAQPQPHPPIIKVPKPESRSYRQSSPPQLYTIAQPQHTTSPPLPPAPTPPAPVSHSLEKWHNSISCAAPRHSQESSSRLNTLSAAPLLRLMKDDCLTTAPSEKLTFSTN